MKHYIAKIDSVNGGIVFGTIEDKLESFGENKYDLNIAPAVIKRDRFESLLENPA